MNKFLNVLDGSLKYLLLAIVAQFVKFQFFGSNEMSLYFVLRENYPYSYLPYYQVFFTSYLFYSLLQNIKVMPN